MKSALVITLALACLWAQAEELRWRKLPAVPDAEGFAGAFAGTSDGALVLAGGANFPDKKPWQGGKKAWYDTVWTLSGPDANWTVAGKLPRPLGYGVSVTHDGGVICVGGGDAGRHYADAFRLELKNGRLRTTTLPSLPTDLANACGALSGDCLYLAGGTQKPDSREASRKAFVLNLAATRPQWREIAPLPGPGRILAAAAGADGAFWVFGGADLAADETGKVSRRYLKDAWRYDPSGGWKRLTDLPYPLAASPSPTAQTPGNIFIIGGDDGSGVNIPPENRGAFSSRVLVYDIHKNSWREDGEIPSPCVTTPLVPWENGWAMPCGEIRPGVRSPGVWRLEIGAK